MIDLIYQIVKTVLNKELRGNLSPDEFNKMAKQVQDSIYAGYFGDLNLITNKQNRGLVNRNHANVAKQMNQKISRFSEIATLNYDSGTNRFDLPPNVYFMNDNGLLYKNNVIEEARSGSYGFLSSSLATPSTTFPVFEDYGEDIKIYPETIVDSVTLRYIRTPADPKWTYTVTLGTEMYDNTISDHQDFELHQSELPIIVIEMLSLFGINLREAEVSQYAEALKRIVEVKKQQ